MRFTGKSEEDTEGELPKYSQMDDEGICQGFRNMELIFVHFQIVGVSYPGYDSLKAFNLQFY